MMMIFGNILGTVIITLGFVVFQDYFWPTIALAAVELLTMIGTVLWVQEGSAARPREGKSWATIARETWATDILKERSYVWLVASRFFFLTAAGMFINIVVFYMERTLGFTGETSVTIPVVNATIEEKAFWINVAIVIFAVVVLVVTVPSARASDQVGRKPVIWTACGLGAAGMALATIAPSVAVVIPGVIMLAAAYGIFLAVDWAFMTDIVPKISAGRYMGLSNVATASATAAAPALGGGIIFVTSSLVTSVAGEAAGLAAGPRFAYAASVGLFLVAALLLRPVRDVAHERLLGAHGSGTPQEADRAA
jgi:MFS family permease